MSMGFMLAFAAAVLAAGSSPAQATDLYVVYLDKDRSLLRDVVEHFPDEWNIKVYDADILSIADHSGRHRVARKLQHADYVIFIGERARRSFRHTFLRYDDSVTLTKDNHEAEIEKLISRFSSP